jgi:hypothetical protein
MAASITRMHVHFVDIDIVDRCAGDGCVEAGEELLRVSFLRQRGRANGLATLCSDRHGAKWFHDDDLTVFGELVEIPLPARS